MSFRKNIEYLRKGNNLSQEDLAFKLGVSRQAVSKWESGGAYPETEKMMKMCSIFNCTLDDLLNSDLEEERKEKEGRYTFSDIVEEFTGLLKRTFYMFDHMGPKSLFKFFFEMFILFVLILILHIPFNYLFELGNNILINIGGTISQLFISSWKFVIEIVYIVSAVVLFVYIYKVRFLDRFDIVKEKIEKKEVYEFEVEKKENIEVVRYDFGIFSFFGKVILFFIKCFTIFVSLPIVFLLFLCVSSFVIGGVLIFSGVSFFGYLVVILSVIGFTIALLNILYNFIVNRRSNWKRLFYIFLISIVGLGLGTGISVLEFTNMMISLQAPVNVQKKYLAESIDMRDDLIIQNLPYNSEYIIDNTLSNTVKIEVGYYSTFSNGVDIQEDTNTSDVFIYSDIKDSVNMKDLYNILVGDLRYKRLSDYTKLGELSVKIYSSEENINKIKENVLERVNSY